MNEMFLCQLLFSVCPPNICQENNSIVLKYQIDVLEAKICAEKLIAFVPAWCEILFCKKQVGCIACRTHCQCRWDDVSNRLVSFKDTISFCNCSKFLKMTMQGLQRHFLCNMILFLSCIQKNLHNKTPTFGFYVCLLVLFHRKHFKIDIFSMDKKRSIQNWEKILDCFYSSHS